MAAATELGIPVVIAPGANTRSVANRAAYDHPRWKDRGVTEADLDSMAEAASKVTRLLDNNPRPMTKSDMREIYRKLL